ncbi:MAG: methylaspartate mutase accessory protein GlmL [Clostridia bacterium]|nr:methylaspartate mutase accessory protein GlmL [Clostridia bacterium]
MDLVLTVDFGSTFTKVVAVDPARGELVGSARAPSTVGTDIMVGLENALAELKRTLKVRELPSARILASSSAAGGLRVVVVGLVSELTTKAAREAALGAGAKIVGHYSYGLSPQDVNHIEAIGPDLILLTGGTDGGNTEVILRNAQALAASKLDCPIVVAGNKMAAAEVEAILRESGKYVWATENVLPELTRLNVEPARAAIREVFMRHIIRAKGLDKARTLVEGEIIPTPLAVLRAAALLARGAGGEPGWGELMVVDVGGATTDVCSLAQGKPSASEVVPKGLPEPYEKRTVEGDLGIRYNALTILETAGTEAVLDKIRSLGLAGPRCEELERAVRYLGEHTEAVPQSEKEHLIDLGLAATAVDLATQRHAGRIEEIYYPTGKVRVLYGKDLTGVRTIVGTGGILAFGRWPGWVLRAACFSPAYPESLRPKAPRLYIDRRYIMFAVGLLSAVDAAVALRLMKQHLQEVTLPA